MLASCHAAWYAPAVFVERRVTRKAVDRHGVVVVKVMRAAGAAQPPKTTCWGWGNRRMDAVHVMVRFKSRPFLLVNPTASPPDPG